MNCVDATWWGLQECQPPAVENDSTSSPLSTPKFPGGVSYDGAAGGGVLRRFKKFTTLRWSMFDVFFWDL